MGQGDQVHQAANASSVNEALDVDFVEQQCVEKLQ
jgi:hypothetical protein